MRIFVPEIDIKTFKKRNRIHVEIIDNGVGVEEDKINEIMIPFFLQKEEGKGTGLGLVHLLSNLKDISGEIHIKSSTMSHTKFSLIL